MIKIFRPVFRHLPLPFQFRLINRIELLYYDAGIGDSFLVGAVAREIKKKYGPKFIIVNGCHHEIFLNNPNVNQTGNAYRGIDLNYHRPQIFRGNFIRDMCRRLGINNPENKVDLFITEDEVRWAKEKAKDYSHPFITIQTEAGGFSADRKLWDVEKWIELVKMLSRRFTLIQLGGKQDRVIPGTVPLSGVLTIRQSAALIQQAQLHIGLVSSLMHVSNAMNTKAIILFGGFEKPEYHNYHNVSAIYSPVYCAPCITFNTKIPPCPNQKICIKDITVEKVLNQVQNVLGIE